MFISTVSFTTSMAKLIKPLALLLLFILLLVTPTTATLDVKKQDPQLSRCKETCQRLLPREAEERECKERCEKEAEQRSGGEQSPEERLRACQQHCESTELQHRPECRKQCVDEYKKLEQQILDQQQQDPKKQYREFKKQCEMQSEGGEEQQKEKEKCQQKCKEDLEDDGRGEVKILVISS